jgi:hypothetical protein
MHHSWEFSRHVFDVGDSVADGRLEFEFGDDFDFPNSDKSLNFFREKRWHHFIQTT